jgi:hypothetical protein
LIGARKKIKIAFRYVRKQKELAKRESASADSRGLAQLVFISVASKGVAGKAIRRALERGSWEGLVKHETQYNIVVPIY